MEGELPVISWCWRREPSAPTEVTELFNLLDMLFQVRISQAPDAWSWRGDSDGTFSVRSARKWLEEGSIGAGVASAATGELYSHFSLLPKKVNVFWWRALKEALPTRLALVRRHIPVNSLLCPLCLSADESLVHLFANCYVSTVVWHKLSSWISLPLLQASSIKDIEEYHRQVRGSPFKVEAVRAIVLVTCWLLWKHRNNIIFKSSTVNINLIVEEIKIFSFLWVANRQKKEVLSWDSWCKFSFL